MGGIKKKAYPGVEKVKPGVQPVGTQRVGKSQHGLWTLAELEPTEVARTDLQNSAR